MSVVANQMHGPACSWYLPCDSLVHATQHNGSKLSGVKRQKFPVYTGRSVPGFRWNLLTPSTGDEWDVNGELWQGQKELKIIIFNILDLYFLARNARIFFLENGGSSCLQNTHKSTLRHISEGRNLSNRVSENFWLIKKSNCRTGLFESKTIAY